jgi:DNA invertase Pin-like site-specific DNA recombinase
MRHRVFLGNEAFAERHRVASRPPERLREVPRAQRRPLADFARRYPERREAMARAFRTGVYSMQEIADYFGVHYSTVSRAVRRLEPADGQTARCLSSRGMLDCKT